MATTYKAGDTLTPPPSWTYPQFVPTLEQTSIMDALYQIYVANGEQLTTTEIKSLFANDDVYASAFADINEKVVDSYDTTDFEDIPLHVRMDNIRTSFVGLKSTYPNPGVVSLSNAEWGAVTITDGHVTIDASAKVALYPFVLTSTEASLLNAFKSLLSSLTTLASTPLKVDVSTTLVKRTMDDDGVTGYELRDEELLFMRMFDGHVFPSNADADA